MKYRTAWFSDIHLGTEVSQVEKLLDFIKENDFDKIYLNGDIIDIIAMNKRVYWKTSHSTFIQKILRAGRKGTEIIFCVGNHDIAMMPLVGEDFGNIKIVERDIHETVKGKKYLVLHGHQFDGAIASMPWLYWLGDKAYGFALWLNKWYNRFTMIFGRPYWSLSLFLKSKVKNVVKFIANFEELVAEGAKKENVDGVCAGHIHVLEDRVIDGIHYLNSGCSTEFVSCIVEHEDGTMEAKMIYK